MPYFPRASTIADYARFKVLARSHMREAPALARWEPHRDSYVNGMYVKGVEYADEWARRLGQCP